MQDNKLLDSAARSAGIPWQRWDYDRLRGLGHNVLPSDMWNPLENDGDALRLAVKLGMGVQSNGPDHWQSPNRTIVLFDGAECPFRLTQAHGDDAVAATRRAIVRAAAEIGDAMPSNM